jgi:hypothetical protein
LFASRVAWAGESVPCPSRAWTEDTDAENRGLALPFGHPDNTPYIENIVVHLWGADDRIQELLKTVHWSEVNAALAP